MDLDSDPELDSDLFF